MARPGGEMPFLDHLEELRSRLLRSLAALVTGVALGLWIVQRFEIIEFLKRPIAPFLPTGRLVILSPTEPILIVLKLGALVGLVLASPYLLYQVWAFMSPALYEREKRAVVPALLIGFLLFLIGSALGFLVVVPKALPVLLGVQAGAFENMITYDRYFGFVVQVVLALGISFELPLIMILLAVLGLMSPRVMSRFRRHAIVLAFVAGAFLSPGADVFSMLLMTGPLIVLYEIGLAGARIAEHRRLKAAARMALGLVILLAGSDSDLLAQQPPPPPVRQQQPDSAADSLRAAALRVRDSAAARRLGLPSAPSQTFAPQDSVIRELLERLGFVATRFRADSANIRAAEGIISLTGNAMTERSGSILEAEEIYYRDRSCDLRATGKPKLFGQGSPLIGDTVMFDTCKERGIVQSALTQVNEQGANWFVRGNLAVDSVATRVFAASSDITSCDLPVPHYSFAVREVKWLSQSMMVARPAVLYIRDVPVLWLPFLFQDTKSGRRSGILVPQFGINDIVRPNSTFNRQVTGTGYYWAPSDYFDIATRLDWFSNRYVEWGVTGGYRVLSRFMNGDIAYSRRTEDGGSSGWALKWGHSQNFNLNTSLRADISYVSNTAVVNRNSIDPIQTTQQVSSSLNLQRKFAWGSSSLGGSRRQDLNTGSGSLDFPNLTITPKPLDLGNAITWSPNLLIRNTTGFGPSQQLLSTIPPGGGTPDTTRANLSNRNSSLNLATPFRIGTFNWQNSISVVDREIRDRTVLTLRLPNDETPEPNDSINVTRVSRGTFSTELNWDTGINLPLLFQRTWKLQPTVGIVNVLPGNPFAVRNQRTGGDWVVQGKRLEFRLGVAPSFFGFYGGIGPLSRIRHTVSPRIDFAFSPSSKVSEKFATAISVPGRIIDRESRKVQVLSLALSQNFEGKLQRAEGDTTTDDRNLPKLRLLSIDTSPIQYDFEQAKLEGRTGWTTQTITNALLSDLMPGLRLNLTHDLWDGPVGFEGSDFSPFLRDVSASFTLTARTFQGLAALFGLAKRPSGSAPQAGPTRPTYQSGFGFQNPSTQFGNQLQQFGSGAQSGFTTSVNFSLNRTRPSKDPAIPSVPAASNVALVTRFSPTSFWSINWETNYNFTDSRFESHRLVLERDLHDWRAGFVFLRSANGNFTLFFSIFLLDLPDLKFDYNQTTLSR